MWHRYVHPESVVGAVLLGLGATVSGFFAAVGASIGAPFAGVIGIAAGGVLGQCVLPRDLPRTVVGSWVLALPATAIVVTPFLALAGEATTPPLSGILGAVSAALVLSCAAMPLGAAWMSSQRALQPGDRVGTAPPGAVAFVALCTSALLAGWEWFGSLALVRLAAVLPLLLPALLSPPFRGPRPWRRLRWADLASLTCLVVALTGGMVGAVSGARPGHPLPMIPLTVLLPAVLALTLVGAVIGRWSDTSTPRLDP
ncbi:MAG: hypothetical protein H6738_11860 [Alphaproteobacteria bacterium]|nr:hypothetical protein [Alphaproteobacteria bacterium]MCB9697467.1 hypothetical protein [Alphaproteobacteria bacterium]